MLTVDQIPKLGKPARESAVDRLYDAAYVSQAVQVSELGWTLWGYLRRLDEGERKELQVDPSVKAILAWTDGEEECASGVQLLEETDAVLVERVLTGPVVDRIVRHYDKVGGADDGHPAHALWRQAQARRQANAEAEAAEKRKRQENSAALELRRQWAKNGFCRQRFEGEHGVWRQLQLTMQNGRCEAVVKIVTDPE